MWRKIERKARSGPGIGTWHLLPSSSSRPTMSTTARHSDGDFESCVEDALVKCVLTRSDLTGLFGSRRQIFAHIAAGEGEQRSGDDARQTLAARI